MAGGKAQLQWYRAPMAFRTCPSPGALALCHPRRRPRSVAGGLPVQLADDACHGRSVVSARHHMPPALMHAHLDRDLSGPTSGTNGRRPLPDPVALADTLLRQLGLAAGVGDGSQAAACDRDTGSFASRLWWMLTLARPRRRGRGALMAGLPSGPRKAARREAGPKRALRKRSVAASPTSRHARPPLIGVAALRGRLSGSLVDAHARPNASAATSNRSTGSPTAFWRQRRTVATGRISTPQWIVSIAFVRTPRFWLRATLGDHPADRIVCHCGSGATACHNLLALEHAGLTGAKLCAGSRSEWSSWTRVPVEKREPPRSLKLEVRS
mgnify:CR=1 FL=1